jgi:hypothetical protein
MRRTVSSFFCQQNVSIYSWLAVAAQIRRDLYPDVQSQGIMTSRYSAGSVIGLVEGALVLQYLK